MGNAVRWCLWGGGKPGVWTAAGFSLAGTWSVWWVSMSEAESLVW